jgi:uncharacterized membrane protein
MDHVTHKHSSFGIIALIICVVFILTVPFLLYNGVEDALQELKINKEISILIIICIFAGGLLELPIGRIRQEEVVEAVPFRLFGLNRILPRLTKRKPYTEVAVNAGGCIIPVGVVLYEIVRLFMIVQMDLQVQTTMACMILAVGINVIICYLAAKPIQNIGITLNPFVPGIVAVVCGILAMSIKCKPVPIAFAAGVLGPVIGADLLHLKDAKQTETGIVSIGGAGTFDSIVISCLIATLLA